MNRYLALAIIFGAILLIAVVASLNRGMPLLSEHDRLMQSPAYRLSQQYRENRSEEESEKKEAKGYVKYFNEMRANQVTGRIDFEDVYKMRQQIKQSNSQRGKRGIPLNLQWEDLGPDNVGGRTRGLMIDKNNPEHMLAGGVAGGLFVSQNGGLLWAVHPATSDSMGQVGIATIRQASNGDIYVGTGESFAYALGGVPMTNGAPGFIGDGIYKSTDGGQTFSRLPATKPAPNSGVDEWSYVSEIAIDPNDPRKVYAATHGGLKFSDDGGNSWSSPPGVTGNVYSWEVAIGGNGVIYAEVNSRYFRSEDGTNFENLTGTNGFPVNGTGSNSIGRIEFAVSPSDPKYVYAVVATGGEALRGIYKSTDSGQSWTALIPSASETFDVLGFQGTWNIALGIDPLNKDRIFVGGQAELWLYANGGWNQVAASYPDDPDNPYYVHADMHGVYFHPANNNIMYVISDGGIYRSNNAAQQFPTFTMRNKGYNVTQFYGMAASDVGYVMGGSQDNGTQLVDLKGNTRLSADEVSGGDGGDCEISSINPQVMFASSYGGRFVRSSSGGSSFGTFMDNNIDRNGDGNADNASLFVGTSFLWEKDESYMLNDSTLVEIKKSVYFIAGNNQLWFTTGALNLSTQSYWYDVELNGIVSEIEVSSEGVIYCGTTNGNIYRITGLDSKYKVATDTPKVGDTYVIKYVPDFPEPSRPDPSATPPHPGWDWPTQGSTDSYQNMTRTLLTTYSGRFVTGIAVNPGDENHIVVTLGQYGNQNYVYQSTNGTSFASIQNDLPKMPVYDAVIDYYNSNNIILGTESGIWSSTDKGLGWNEENNGLARTIAMKLVQRKLHEADCMVLYAGTHGRGIFRTTTLTKFGCNLVAGEPVGIGNGDVEASVAGMRVYPNPVYDKAIVEFELNDRNKPVNLLVVDLLGRIYRNDKLSSLQAGHNKLEVDFDNLSGGIYMIVLKAGGKTQSKRVVVTK